MNAEGRAPPVTARPVRVAQYLRMSTEHQRYSTEHQALAISQYAAARGYQIVQTYADRGISGVSMRGRDGLKRLLADVIGDGADYTLILVYDVSRWGRFQNRPSGAL
jgi:DNA invertase Pin-like site-specific DNA recombinase